MTSVVGSLRIVFGTLLFGWTISFLVRFLLPRALGVEVFGHYVTTDSLAQALMLTVSWGFAEWASRDTQAHTTATHLTVSIVRAMGILLPTLVAAVVGVAWLLGYPEGLLPLFAATAFFVGMTELNNVTTRLGQLGGHHESLGHITRRNRALWGGGAILIALACSQRYISPEWALLSFLGFSGCLEITRFAATAKTMQLALIHKPTLQGVGTVLAASASFFLNRVFILIYLRLPAIVVSRLPSPGSPLATTSQEAGILGAALTLCGMVLMFVPAFQAVFMPHLSRRHGEGWREAQRALALIALVASAATGGMVLGAKALVFLLFGEEFLAAVPVLQLSSLTLFLTYLLVVLSYLVMLQRKERALAGISAVGVLVTLAASLWFVRSGFFPTGALAAAAATGVNEIFILICIFRLLPRELWRASPLRLALPFAILSLTVAATLAWTFRQASPWLGVPIAAIYSAVHLGLCWAFWKSELRSLYADWSRAT